MPPLNRPRGRRRKKRQPMRVSQHPDPDFLRIHRELELLRATSPSAVRKRRRKLDDLGAR